MKALKKKVSAPKKVPFTSDSKLGRRTAEVALNHGRPADDATSSDLKWAQRELKPLKLTSPKLKPRSGKA